MNLNICLYSLVRILFACLFFNSVAGSTMEEESLKKNLYKEVCEDAAHGGAIGLETIFANSEEGARVLEEIGLNTVDSVLIGDWISNACSYASYIAPLKMGIKFLKGLIQVAYKANYVEGTKEIGNASVMFLSGLAAYQASLAGGTIIAFGVASGGPVPILVVLGGKAVFGALAYGIGHTGLNKALKNASPRIFKTKFDESKCQYNGCHRSLTTKTTLFIWKSLYSCDSFLHHCDKCEIPICDQHAKVPPYKKPINGFFYVCPGCTFEQADRKFGC